jgi:hypothetical protein
MRYSYLLSALASTSLVAAAPVVDARADPAIVKDFNAPPGGDITILNYALTLEFLERKFYQEGLAKFSQADFVAAGFPDPFYANLKEVRFDEEVGHLVHSYLHRC